MHLVGRSPECEAGQEAISEARRTFQTLPIFATTVAGYLAIALVRIAGRRRFAYRCADVRRLDRPRGVPDESRRVALANWPTL